MDKEEPEHVAASRHVMEDTTHAFLQEKANNSLSLGVLEIVQQMTFTLFTTPSKTDPTLNVETPYQRKTHLHRSPFLYSSYAITSCPSQPSMARRTHYRVVESLQEVLELLVDPHE